MRRGSSARAPVSAGRSPLRCLKVNMKRPGRLPAEYVSIFGEGNFYFEIQKHGIAEEVVAFDEMIKLGTSMGIPFIVTNDAHYLHREDASSHEILLCIQTQTTIEDPNRYRFGSDQIYFKSPQEMSSSFPICPKRSAIP